jgi:hypothetical protein
MPSRQNGSTGWEFWELVSAGGAEQSAGAAGTLGAGERDAGIGTVVTTVLRGTREAGESSAATARASCLERWKKRGRTSVRFSGVIALESAWMAVMHKRPSRRGATISGYRWISSAATFR